MEEKKAAEKVIKAIKDMIAVKEKIKEKSKK